MKILIVEDDKILARTIEQCLSNKYDIDKAYDGEEGVMYAKQGIYDAIVLDLMMPIMNGFDVLRELRKSKIYTPVLVLTAKGNVITTPSGSNNSDSSNSKDSSNDSTQTIDYVEIAIDRIQRAVNKLKKVAESAFKSLKKRLNATSDEIEKINEQIAVQNTAYSTYMAKANSINLSSSIKQAVRNGSYSITDYYFSYCFTTEKSDIELFHRSNPVWCSFFVKFKTQCIINICWMSKTKMSVNITVEMITCRVFHSF